MSHNTVFGGVSREIEGGTPLIGGVAREIESGLVLVGGVVREIEFGQKTFTVSIWRDQNTQGSVTVTINGTVYAGTLTLNVNRGDVALCTVKGLLDGNYVSVNGTKVATGTTVEYSYEINSNVNFYLYYVGTWGTRHIDIVTS